MFIFPTVHPKLSNFASHHFEEAMVLAVLTFTVGSTFFAKFSATTVLVAALILLASTSICFSDLFVFGRELDLAFFSEVLDTDDLVHLHLFL